MDVFPGAFVCLCGTLLLVVLIWVAAGIRIVPEDTRLSVYRLGRYIGDKGPGLVLLIPIIDRGVKKQPVTETGNTPNQEAKD